MAILANVSCGGFEESKTVEIPSNCCNILVKVYSFDLLLVQFQIYRALGIRTCKNLPAKMCYKNKMQRVIAQSNRHDVDMKFGFYYIVIETAPVAVISMLANDICFYNIHVIYHSYPVAIVPTPVRTSSVVVFLPRPCASTFGI